MLTSILDTAKKLTELSDLVKDNLLDNPEEASEKLAEVFDELSKVLEFVEKETVSFLKLHILEDGSNISDCRGVLLSLESGYATVKAYEARGHCHKIGNIHKKYLSKWFSRVLDSSQAQELDNIFSMMNSADLDMIVGIREITDWLTENSEKVLDAIEYKDFAGANQIIMDARRSIQNDRREIVGALAQLKLLQASFIASAETV